MLKSKHDKVNQREGNPIFPGSIKWFLASMVLPIFLGVAYFGFLASDMYVSEAKFLVRSPDQASDSGLGGMLKSFTSSSGDSVSIAKEYILSREMVFRLDGALRLREHYAQGDFWSGFHPIGSADREKFYDYFIDHVSISIDTTSSVATLKIKSFDPDYAQKIGKYILQQVSNKINQINVKMQEDLLGTALAELFKARERYTQIQKRIAAFRQAQGILDPERQALLEAQAYQELQNRLIAQEAKRESAMALAPQSPAVRASEIEIQSLRRAMDMLSGAIAGKDDSKAAKAQEYADLLLERDMAARNVALAEEAYLKTRVQNIQKHLYVELIAEPSLPDGATLPRRGRAIGASVLLGFLIWTIGMLLGVGVKEHRRNHDE